jgi:predicted glycosyltransferase
MGLGHVRRQLLIARALSGLTPAPSILMICCAREAAAFSFPPGLDCVTLPAIGKSALGEYRCRRLELALSELVRLRAQTIRAAMESFDPDLVLVDKVPGGFQGELTPALRWLKDRGRAACILGLRDVLDDAEVASGEWVRDSCDELIGEYYSGVWIYGDPRLIDTTREYGFGTGTVEKCAYVGYLNAMDLLRTAGARGPSEPDWPKECRTALCLVGGGDDGEALARAFIEARLPAGCLGVLVTGPYMSAAARDDIGRAAQNRARLRVHEFITEPERFIARADCVIAMAGYNTVCEVLGAGKPLLTVPRVRPRLEQSIRAERLGRLGLLEVLPPEDLSPAAISAWVASEPRTRRDARCVLRFDGLARVSEMARAMLARRRLCKEVGLAAG